MAVPPAGTLTLRTLRPCSAWMNTTVWLPALTLMPTFGVVPKGRPSKITLETGIELMLSVP